MDVVVSLKVVNKAMNLGIEGLNSFSPSAGIKGGQFHFKKIKIIRANAMILNLDYFINEMVLFIYH